MGEEGGRYFLSQMLGVLEYIHGKKCVHRDLKLENILVDDDLNLKVADFGFATYRKIHALQSFRGTMTYMAPEIIEGKTYDGVRIDLFSTAVILYIIVQGNFPFRQAKTDEFYYNLICGNQLDTYWEKTGGEHLSNDFKDLIIQMFSYDPESRLTIEKIKQHPWMQAPFDIKTVRDEILENLESKRELQTADTSREDVDSRGDKMLDLVKMSSEVEVSRFNDVTDYDVDVVPGVIWDDLNSFNSDHYAGKMKIQYKEHKYIKMNMDEIEVKVKFFKHEEDSSRIRVRFLRKKGDIQTWYKILKEMKEALMKDILLQPSRCDI